MKTIETLSLGETLLVNAKQVKGGKVSLQFAEIINNPNRATAAAGSSLVSLLNKSDKRFSTKARRAWITGEKSDIQEALGLDLSSLNNEGDVKELNVLNPEIGGSRARLIITETVRPTDYQRDNIDTTAKRAGKGGNFITCGGKYIFVNASVVPCDGDTADMHTFLESDKAPEAEGISASDAIEMQQEAYEAQADAYADGLNV